MWEHMVVDAFGTEDKVQQEVDKASSNGWELVSTCPVTDEAGGTIGCRLFFKRPKR